MAVPKEYIHDRLILLLLTISAFFTVLGSILVLLRLNPGSSEVYTVQYRANLGVSHFTPGHAPDILAFIVFMFVVLIMNTILSIRVFTIHRQFSVVILGLGLLLLGLAIIVSNALLVLR